MKIFVDMDGVLTDAGCQFNIFFKEGTWLEVQRKKGRDYGVNLVHNAGYDFWTTMPWMLDGQELWNFIKKFTPVILSDPKKFKCAISGKYEWVNKNISPYQHVILTSEKHLFADKDRILIDDYSKNINNWTKAGGVGILHKNAKQTINELENILFS